MGVVRGVKAGGRRFDVELWRHPPEPDNEEMLRHAIRSRDLFRHPEVYDSNPVVAVESSAILEEEPGPKFHSRQPMVKSVNRLITLMQDHEEISRAARESHRTRKLLILSNEEGEPEIFLPEDVAAAIRKPVLVFAEAGYKPALMQDFMAILNKRGTTALSAEALALLAGASSPIMYVIRNGKAHAANARQYREILAEMAGERNQRRRKQAENRAQAARQELTLTRRQFLKRLFGGLLLTEGVHAAMNPVRPGPERIGPFRTGYEMPQQAIAKPGEITGGRELVRRAVAWYEGSNPMHGFRNALIAHNLLEAAPILDEIAGRGQRTAIVLGSLHASIVEHLTDPALRGKWLTPENLRKYTHPTTLGRIAIARIGRNGTYEVSVHRVASPLPASTR